MPQTQNMSQWRGSGQDLVVGLEQGEELNGEVEGDGKVIGVPEQFAHKGITEAGAKCVIQFGNLTLNSDSLEEQDQGLQPVQILDTTKQEEPSGI